MAVSPRIVTADRQIFWDGVTQRLPKGQVLDVPPGSALEREIGRDYLVPLPGADVAQPPAAETAPQEETAPAKPRAAVAVAVKKQAGDDKDGEP